MANVDAPYGFKPVRYKSGAPYNGACNAYYVPATDADTMGIGDLVYLTGTANAAAIGNHKIGTLQTVTALGTASNNFVVGAIVGFETFDTDFIYKAASTATVVFVADDPAIVYQAQCDATTFLAVADAGLNASCTAGTVNAITGVSTQEIDSSTKATTNSLPVRILNLTDFENNEVLANAVWDCIINTHAEKSVTGL